FELVARDLDAAAAASDTGALQVDQAVARPGNAVGLDTAAAERRNGEEQAVAGGTAHVARAEALAGKQAAIPADAGILDDHVAACLDLVAGVGLDIDAPEHDLRVCRGVQKIEAVLAVVVGLDPFEQPVTTGLGDAQAVAVATLLLAPASLAVAAGPAFDASIPGDLDVAELHPSTVGRALSAIAEIAVPARPAVAAQPHALQYPVAQPPRADAVVGKPVDVEIGEVDARRIGRTDADRGPLAIRRLVARTGRRPGVELDACGVIGDLEAGEFHIMPAGEGEHHGGAPAPPELGPRLAAPGPAGAPA